MVRRGADLVLEGVWDLAKAEVCWRDRVLPLSGDKEGILGRASMNFDPNFDEYQVYLTYARAL